MTIQEIYEKYDIPPNLQDHQVTVASVAKNICDLVGYDNRDEVITACLFHDMGNIIKFKLDSEAPGLKIENIDHWREVQKKFIDTYGNDEHLATMKIAKDIGLSEIILEIIDAVGFTHSVDTLASKDISKMIAAYSDMRVAPLGVVALEERLSDLVKRYGATDDREQYNAAFREMEKLIFSNRYEGPRLVEQETVDQNKQNLFDLEI